MYKSQLLRKDTLNNYEETISQSITSVGLYKRQISYKILIT